MKPIDRDKLNELLSAYVDGELSDAERRVVEDSLRADPNARTILGELRKIAELVGSLPRRGAPPSLIEELQVRLERSELLEDVEVAAPGSRRWRSWMVGLSAVAALVVVVLTGRVWFGEATKNGLPQDSLESGAVAKRDHSDGALSVGETLGRAESAEGESGVASRSMRGSEPGERLADANESRRGREHKELASESDLLEPAKSKARGPAEEVARRASVRGSHDESAPLVAKSSPENADDVRSPPLEGEAVQLRVAVNNSDVQEELLQRLTSHLGRSGVTEVGDLARKRDDHADDAGPGEFYHVERPSLNARQGAGQRHILVHIRASRVTSLLDELRPSVTDREVTLIDGTDQVVGFSEVDKRLGRGEKSEGGDQEIDPRGDRGAARSHPGEKLLRFLGLDREWIRRLSQPQNLDASARDVTTEMPGPANRTTEMAAAAPDTSASTAVRAPAADGTERAKTFSAANRPTSVDPSEADGGPSEEKETSGSVHPSTGRGMVEPSLVNRRLRELDEPKDSSGTGEEGSAVVDATPLAQQSPLADAPVDTASDGNSYITLVIELSIAPPSDGSVEPATPGSAPSPAPQPDPVRGSPPPVKKPGTTRPTSGKSEPPQN